MSKVKLLLTPTKIIDAKRISPCTTSHQLELCMTSEALCSQDRDRVRTMLRDTRHKVRETRIVDDLGKGGVGCTLFALLLLRNK